MIKQLENGILVDVKVNTKASNTSVVGIANDRLKIKLNAVPEDGKANKELIKFFSKKLKISKQKIEIVKGFTSSLKTVLFAGLDRDVFISTFLNKF